MFFEGFYGLDKKGGFKVWAISVQEAADHAVILVSHGKEGGEQQHKTTKITAGKQGRTTYEQAISEAEGKIKKQVDKGYRKTKEELVELPLLAMLAGDYRKIGHRINYKDGVDLSDKLDGVRCLAKRKDGVITLESRTGQPYDVPHIAEELSLIMQDGDVLDGELYVHGEILQDITSAVKRIDPDKEIKKAQKKYQSAVGDEAIAEAYAELEAAIRIQEIRERLGFIIFDLPSELPWHERLEALQEYHDTYIQPVGVRVNVLCFTRAFSEEEMKAAHKDAVARGFEGIMIRNRDGMYESGKRSADLQKYKEFLDSEFFVVDVGVDKDGYGVLECQNDLTTERFTVTLGSHSERAYQCLFKHEFIGKWLTVKYQSRYKKTLLPQFPTGVAFRACDEHGNPVD